MTKGTALSSTTRRPRWSREWCAMRSGRSRRVFISGRFFDRFRDIDALVPLPLFAARQKKRGYNQSAVLCDGMAGIMMLPVINNAVIRLSATETQTRKNRIERWQNMEGKFELVNAAGINGKHILLVDDVITTGATLEACGHELLKAEGVQLSIATLAYTV